jgi:hypothetical protein
MAKPLSPAAQAVLDAAFSAYWSAEQEAPNDEGMIAAAALKAAADQDKEFEVPFAAIDEWEKIKGSCASFYAAAEWGRAKTMEGLLAIADELEGGNE